MGGENNDVKAEGSTERMRKGSRQEGRNKKKKEGNKNEKSAEWRGEIKGNTVKKRY